MVENLELLNKDKVKKELNYIIFLKQREEIVKDKYILIGNILDIEQELLHLHLNINNKLY